MRAPGAVPPLSGPVRITPAMLPNEANADFKDSSFFRRFDRLPSPAEVQAQARAQHLQGKSVDKRRGFSADLDFYKPLPAVFESLGLFVKWGGAVSIAEGQCLYAINHFLRGFVPVPEIYGWRTEKSHVYIYMEALEGQTLEKMWDTMNDNQRNAICQQLKISFDNLRQLEQCPKDRFIEFHDWFSFLCRRPMPDPYSVNFDWIRDQLPDDAAIKFTHGDLHRSNIIVKLTPQPHVVGIIDWEQSGWLPEYWEERKAIFTTFQWKEWASTYLPKILQSYKNTEEAWGFFTEGVV
ncbi:hypothetical protein CISG_10332 [Coccidioides immitis RMSCC 3703]|uniref:Aminoglycoside phosphotransferase domain-containing protein n=3 Tax=Coccidioides TaxID=5500 RepID=A0A0J8QPB9_COCIT|nr:hypothetical protein CPAG_04744 [Coccidioides posadasii RMSCC 3488]KMP02503.1 hypothetical protein CIRG_10326 [Coccidioides immitis RMSCC 2394]KMU74359.1 hypothetical protein CISG_10332 [Coccidioides immitis RMSCC 3703]